MNSGSFGKAGAFGGVRRKSSERSAAWSDAQKFLTAAGNLRRMEPDKCHAALYMQRDSMAAKLMRAASNPNSLNNRSLLALVQFMARV